MLVFVEADPAAGQHNIICILTKYFFNESFSPEVTWIHESLYIPSRHNDLLGNPRDFEGNGQLVWACLAEKELGK